MLKFSGKNHSWCHVNIKKKENHLRKQLFGVFKIITNPSFVYQ